MFYLLWRKTYTMYWRISDDHTYRTTAWSLWRFPRLACFKSFEVGEGDKAVTTFHFAEFMVAYRKHKQIVGEVTNG